MSNDRLKYVYFGSEKLKKLWLKSQKEKQKRAEAISWVYNEKIRNEMRGGD